MRKFEKAKYIVYLKARIKHNCFKCGRTIEAGEFYCKEKLDMRPPTYIVLNEYCEKCGSAITELYK